MRYLAYGVEPALLVLLVAAIAHSTIAFLILTNPAIQSSSEPNEGRQRESDGQVFHCYEEPDRMKGGGSRQSELSMSTVNNLPRCLLSAEAYLARDTV